MTAEEHSTPCTAFGTKKKDDGHYPYAKMAHQCSISKMFISQGARRASQVTPGCRECNYCDQTFLASQGKTSYENAHIVKDHRLKKRRTPNGRVKLRNVLSVAVPRKGVDSPEAGVSEEVEKAFFNSSRVGVIEELKEVGVDSPAAAVSMEVQEVDDDSGDNLCRLFGD